MSSDVLVFQPLPTAEVAHWLPKLSEWLLPDAHYPVQHTWPQVYRSDGRANHLGIFSASELVSHLAIRSVVLRGEHGPLRAALIGSVATAPQMRGQGLAGALLEEALTHCRAAGVDLALLWAERPDLYARHGFETAGVEQICAVAGRNAQSIGVRVAEHRDHTSLRTLHDEKPLRVERDQRDMSLLLSIPGMCTTVLERDDSVVAYACLGKGADFPGWWHEVGGTDVDVALLLEGSMTLLDLPAAMLLLPPYRTALRSALGDAIIETHSGDGPMVVHLTDAGHQRFWVDGLDSI